MAIVRPIYKLDDIPDVDTPTPTVDHVLKWNGSAWVATAEGTTFALSITSFTNNGGSQTQATYSGTWKNAGQLTFTVAYAGSTPTSATITLTSNGGVSWSAPLTLVAPFTSGTNTESVAMPNSSNRYIDFTVDADSGAGSDSETFRFTFGNFIYRGRSTKNSGFVDSDVRDVAFDANGCEGERFAATALTYNTPFTVTGMDTAGYFLYAHPSYMGNLASGWQFWMQGTSHTVTQYYPLPCNEEVLTAFDQLTGYNEDYRVYAAQEDFSAVLGSTASIKIDNTSVFNYPDVFFWGNTPNAGPVYTESDLLDSDSGGPLLDCDGIATMTDGSQQFTIVNPGGEYIVVAIPGGVTDDYTKIQFWVNGIQGGFLYCGRVAIDGPWGFQLGSSLPGGHYIFRALNSGLGSTTVTTTILP